MDRRARGKQTSGFGRAGGVKGRCAVMLRAPHRDCIECPPNGLLIYDTNTYR